MLNLNSFVVFVIFIVILIIVLLLASKLISISNYSIEKVGYYECGFESYYIMNRSPISIVYYMVAIIFMVFDVEILFIYPYIYSCIPLGIYGYFIFISFFIIITIGLIYEYYKNVLSIKSLFYTPH